MQDSNPSAFSPNQAPIQTPETNTASINPEPEQTPTPPVAAPVPEQPKKSKKGLIIGAVITAVIIVVAIILLIMLGNKPSDGNVKVSNNPTKSGKTLQIGFDGKVATASKSFTGTIKSFVDAGFRVRYFGWHDSDKDERLITKDSFDEFNKMVVTEEDDIFGIGDVSVYVENDKHDSMIGIHASTIGEAEEKRDKDGVVISEYELDKLVIGPHDYMLDGKEYPLTNATVATVEKLFDKSPIDSRINDGGGYIKYEVNNLDYLFIFVDDKATNCTIQYFTD